MTRESSAGPIALLVALGVGLASFGFGFIVLVSATGTDHASPVPAHQRWLAIAGVVAAAGFLALLRVGEEGPTRLPGALIVVVVLVAAVCALPLWVRYSTVDVSADGFHRPAYDGYFFDVYVYNATDAPIVVTTGDDARFPARLRPPGRRVAPHDRVALKWPNTLYGTFTLAVTGPLAPGARGSVPVTRRKPPENRGV